MIYHSIRSLQPETILRIKQRDIQIKGNNSQNENKVDGYETERDSGGDDKCLNKKKFPRGFQDASSFVSSSKQKQTGLRK